MSSFQVVQVQSDKGKVLKQQISLEVVSLAGLLCNVHINYISTGRILPVEPLVDSLHTFGQDYKDLHSLGNALHSELKRLLDCEVLSIKLVDVLADKKTYELKSKKPKKRKRKKEDDE